MLSTVLTIAASIPSPSINHFQLGPLRINFYSLCLMAGIIAGTVLLDRRVTARGGREGHTVDVVLIAVPLGIVGSRVYHVLTHPGFYFHEGANPWAVFYTWEGGIAIFGGLIGGTIGAWLGCRRRGIRLLSFADAAAPALLLAQCIARLGNWFNQELYGRPTALPWGLEIDPDNYERPVGSTPETLFHPTFLYEMVWNGLGAFVLIWAGRRFQLQWGRLFGLYLIWYGSGRIFWESLRIDPSEVILGLRTNQWTAILAVVLGLSLMIIQQRRHPDPEPSIYQPGREPEPEIGAVVASPIAMGTGPELAPEDERLGSSSESSTNP